MAKKKTKKNPLMFKMGGDTIEKNPAPENATRLMIGIPTTGLVRVEWMSARFGQVIPTNWSHADVMQFMGGYMPLQYQLPDAENLIAKACVEQGYEWLLFIESDNVIPPNTFRKINEYMVEGKEPVVGGLYFTKSVPPEPMIYRGIGTGYYDKWKFGDKVRCDGLPFGCTLISGKLLKAVWDDSPEYIVPGSGIKTRRVFDSSPEGWRDPFSGAMIAKSGTTDLAFFQRVIRGGYLKKAGFPNHAKMKYPFLVDTTIFVRHIDANGIQWPMEIPMKYEPDADKLEAVMKEFTGPFK